jgi:uncharacterized protein (TIGR04255 family)
MMSDAPNFANPPIVELVLGAQFSPLTKLTSGHFGLFWKALGADWAEPSDDAPVADQFERFDSPRWEQVPGLQLRFEPIRLPGRFKVAHRDHHRLIQVQATRFHLNWRKREGFYPSYRSLIAEFEQTFVRFEAFVRDAGLGAVSVNQWELTYTDAFPQGEYWATPADWPTFLPGLFGPLRAADGLVLETRAAEWSYEIAPKRGRLYIAAQVGQSADSQKLALLLHSTARGPVGKGGADTLRAGLDLGHDAAVGTFLRVTSDEIKARWKTRS